MPAVAIQPETRQTSDTGLQADQQRKWQPDSLLMPEMRIRRQASVTKEPAMQPLPFVPERSRDEMPWEEQLLTTKYLVPYPLYALIPRHQLMKLLDDGMSRPLTLVSAPAGFGKTTLLSAWARFQQSNNAQVAWLSLTEEDNDLTRFWTYILAALNKAQPEICADLITLLQKRLSTDLVIDLNVRPKTSVGRSGVEHSGQKNVR